MNFKNFVTKHFSASKIFLSILVATIMFISLYFDDKPISFQTIKEHINDPMMHWCLLFSLFSAVFLFYSIAINKNSPKNQK